MLDGSRGNAVSLKPYSPQDSKPPDLSESAAPSPSAWKNAYKRTLSDFLPWHRAWEREALSEPFREKEGYFQGFPIEFYRVGVQRV